MLDVESLNIKSTQDKILYEILLEIKSLRQEVKDLKFILDNKAVEPEKKEEDTKGTTAKKNTTTASKTTIKTNNIKNTKK